MIPTSSTDPPAHLSRSASPPSVSASARPSGISGASPPSGICPGDLSAPSGIFWPCSPPSGSWPKRVERILARTGSVPAPSWRSVQVPGQPANART